MMIYLIKSSFCLSAFLLVYYFILERENMHVFKRFYLLISLVFSFVVPFVSFEFKAANALVATSNNLQTVVLPAIQISSEKNYFSTILYIIYGLITFAFLARFIWNLYNIQKVRNTAEIINFQNAKLALVDAPILPHTFGNTIFINKQSYESEAIETELFTHELTHVREKHTLDVLLIELLKTIFWFNPLLILYKRAIQLNHEFLADYTVISVQKKISNYQYLLLSQSIQPCNLYLTSNLNSFLKTKKRFIMMTKTTSKVRETLSQLSVLPVVAGLIFISCSETSLNKNVLNQKNSGITETTLVDPKDYKTVPSFPGGNDALYNFISKNYKKTNNQRTDGKTMVFFDVESDGSLTNFQVLKNPDNDTAEEMIRVLKLSPKWIPAEIDGEFVSTNLGIPVIVE